MVHTCGTIGKPSRKILKKVADHPRDVSVKRKKVSEENHSAVLRVTFHVLPFTVLEHDARTKLADFFSILLGRCCEMGHEPIAD
jgi:hypothetical protein